MNNDLQQSGAFLIKKSALFNYRARLKKMNSMNGRYQFFPNGDYYFFIHKDFEWGYLGHPWEKTITIFGRGLIKGFEKHQPKMFQKVLRQG